MGLIQQRVYSLTPVTANAGGSRQTAHILQRRRHRWLNWHAWIIHEVSVFPVDAALVELASSGSHSWVVFAQMRDPDMWGEEWTNEWFDPTDGELAGPGALVQNPSQWAGLLQYARQRTNIVTSATGEAMLSARHAWTSFPRLVAADSIMFQYGTTANAAPQADLIVRYENVFLPGWRAWEEAVMHTMGRVAEAQNP